MRRSRAAPAFFPHDSARRAATAEPAEPRALPLLPALDCLRPLPQGNRSRHGRAVGRRVSTYPDDVQWPCTEDGLRDGRPGGARAAPGTRTFAHGAGASALWPKLKRAAPAAAMRCQACQRDGRRALWQAVWRSPARARRERKTARLAFDVRCRVQRSSAQRRTRAADVPHLARVSGGIGRWSSTAPDDLSTAMHMPSPLQGPPASHPPPASTAARHPASMAPSSARVLYWFRTDLRLVSRRQRGGAAVLAR
jgi:hypothetical protein